METSTNTGRKLILSLWAQKIRLPFKTDIIVIMQYREPVEGHQYDLLMWC